MVVELEVDEETGGSFVDFKVVSTSDVGEKDSVIPVVESVVVLYTDVSVGINVDSNVEDIASVKSVVNPSVDKSEGKVSVSVLDDGSEVEIEEVFSVEVILKDVVSVTVLDEGSVEE